MTLVNTQSAGIIDLPESEIFKIYGGTLLGYLESSKYGSITRLTPVDLAAYQRRLFQIKYLPANYQWGVKALRVAFIEVYNSIAETFGKKLYYESDALFIFDEEIGLFIKNNYDALVPDFNEAATSFREFRSDRRKAERKRKLNQLKTGVLFVAAAVALPHILPAKPVSTDIAMSGAKAISSGISQAGGLKLAEAAAIAKAGLPSVLPAAATAIKGGLAKAKEFLKETKKEIENEKPVEILSSITETKKIIPAFYLFLILTGIFLIAGGVK